MCSNPKRYYLILSVVLFLIEAGCTSPKIKNATAKAAEIIGAANYSVSSENAPNGEQYNILILEFSNLNKLTEGLTENEIIYMSLLAFCNELSLYDYINYGKIKVVLRKESTEYSAEYDTRELEKVEHFLKTTVSGFIYAMKERTYESSLSYFDSTHVALADRQTLQKAFQKMDSVYGKAYRAIYTGYGFTEVGDEKIPVFVSTFMLQYDSSLIDVQLMVSIETEKIVHLSINKKNEYE